MTVGSKVKQTLASLKGIEATLRVYSAQSRNQEEMQAFTDALNTTEEIVKDLEMRVKTLEYEEPQYKGF
jgi:GrpB-like predicted nucleotidyltransferase (UPF0157 family)